MPCIAFGRHDEGGLGWCSRIIIGVGGGLWFDGLLRDEKEGGWGGMCMSSRMYGF